MLSNETPPVQSPIQDNADQLSPREVNVDQQSTKEVTADHQSPREVNADSQSPREVNADSQSPREVNADYQSPRKVNEDHQSPREVNADYQILREVNTDYQSPRGVITDQQSIREVNAWIRFGMRLGLSAALHPFEYAKVLIQLGYEPIPAQPGISLLGRPIMQLPNIFGYVGYMRSVGGLRSCYRGLMPRILGSLASVALSEKLAARIGFSTTEILYKDDSEITEEERYAQFKDNLQRDLILSASGILVSHPFHVISLRMMAQFVGREKIYSSFVGSVREIFHYEGLLGFFVGVLPKLLCDLSCLVLTSTAVYFCNKHIVKDRIGRQYNAGLIQFAFSTLLYPLQVVSTCMTITGCRLLIAKPPLMAVYDSAWDCWTDLKQRGELNRGLLVFWRSVGAYSKALPPQRSTNNSRFFDSNRNMPRIDKYP